ncbi:MAG: DUF4159 domain-containing protein [Hyphomicrobiales bacterium]|nr:DUF4159 domain-containing protein [Hyphomicrobiales bacterium]
MIGLPVAFVAPLALIGLLALPVIWLLLRVTPPRPERTPFPPLRLLLDIERRDETPARTPWWLLLLRLAVAGLACLAFAGPIWNPAPAGEGGKAPMLVMLDDGWAAAPDWDKRIAFAASAIEAAGRRGAPVALMVLSEGAREPTLADSAHTLDALRAKKPQPYAPARLAALPAIESFAQAHKGAGALWIADGLEAGDARAFAEKLAHLFGASLDFASEDRLPLALAGARNEAQGLIARVLRASPASAAAGRVRASDMKGQTLAEAPFVFQKGNEAEAKIDLPVELRNDVARLDIIGEKSAGAVSLLDDRWKRRRVGLVSGASADVAQPLLAPNYYLSKALGPYADVREARADATDPIGALIDDGVDVLVLSDMAIGAPDVREKLDKFLAEGGVLVRFAGTRLAGSQDDLTPVQLRRSGRVLGGALSWETPKKLGPFDEKSPFAGLAAPDDVTVLRQVLAEPEPGLPARTWAQLADHTPLVTAERRGKGLLVLFHITADTTWSNLPISGLFPEMLRRIVALSGAAAHTAPAEEELSSTDAPQKAETFAPNRTLDGFGAFGAPPGNARALAAGFRGAGSADHPPGFYGPSDALVAVNALEPDANLAAADLSGISARRATIEQAQPIDLRAPLIACVFMLLLADALASLWLGGGLRGFRARRASAAVAVLATLGALAFHAGDARAQNAPPPAQQPGAPTQRDIDAALVTRLAYVVTGDPRADEASKAGLQSLSRTLAERTSLTPGDPVGVDPARDELVFYPMLYWPISATRPQPTAAAVQKIAAYMKQGGMIVFDTRDALTQRPGGPPTPEQSWLRKLLEGVDVPELEPVPRDHVVTKTFYLIDGFIGRTANGQTWIEALPPETPDTANRPARAGDSVSPIVIASNDLAAAWAGDRYGEGRYPLVPGGARQRELALRGGVNLVMYTLTGNYKADQVHVRDLLNRLGH